MEANTTIPVNSDKPGGGPSALAPQGPRQAVEFFVQIIGGLYEKDYGDFMRKAVLYIERLRADLASVSAKEVAGFSPA